MCDLESRVLTMKRMFPKVKDFRKGNLKDKTPKD